MKKKRRLKKVPKFILTVILACLAVVLMFVAIAGGIYLNAVQMDKRYASYYQECEVVNK